MANPQYKNTNTQLSDFLKSMGKPSTPSAIKSQFEESGLNNRLGSFTGAPNQNLALMKNLTPGAPIQSKVPAVVPQVLQSKVPTLQSKVPATTAISTVAKPVVAPKPATSSMAAAVPYVNPNANFFTPPPSTVSQDQPYQQSQYNATDALSALGIRNPNMEDITNSALNSSEFKLFQQGQDLTGLGLQSKAETDKLALEEKTGQDIAKTKNSLAQRNIGLAGLGDAAIKDLTDSLAASKLGVDREMAQKLLEQGQASQEKFATIAGDLIKEAETGNKEALGQLNQAGYALVGGQIVPTFSAKNSEATFNQRLTEYDQKQQQQKFDNDVKIKQLNIQAQNAITSQERNAILDQIRMVNLQNLTSVSPGQIVNASTGLPAKLTETQRTKYAGYDNLLNTFVPQLRDALSKVTTGGVAGRYLKNVQSVPLLQKTLSADQQNLITTIQNLANERLYTQSGAQINEQEMQRIRDTLPRLEYTNAQNAVQLQNLEQTFKDIYNNKLRLEGLGVAADTPINSDYLTTALDGEDILITD